MAKEKTENNARIEPTKSELEILQVLWQHGPSTVRFVMVELNKIRELNYTATLKLMQLMVDKGILKRDERKMQHVYHVVEAEDKTRERLLDKFADRMLLTGRQHVIVWLRLLQHEPHAFHVVAGMAPIAPRGQIAEVELFLQAKLDCRDRAADHMAFHDQAPAAGVAGVGAAGVAGVACG